MNRQLFIVLVFAFGLGGFDPTGFLAKAIGQDRLNVENKARVLLINDVIATHPLARFVDESSAAAAEVNLGKIDVAEVTKIMTEIAGPQNEVTRFFAQAIPSLREAGVERMHLLVSMQIPTDQAPLIVMAHPDPRKLLPIAKQAFPTLQGRIDAGVVLVGSPQRLQRLVDQQTQKTSPLLSGRTEKLIAPLIDADRADHTLVVSLPQSAKEALVSFWPEKTAPNFPLSCNPRQLAKEIESIVVGAKLPPDASLKAEIQCISPEASARVLGVAQEAIATFGQLTKGVTAEPSGHHVVVQFDETVLEVFKTILKGAHGSATRADRMNRLKQTGLAIHNYAAEHNHLPPRCFIDREGNELHSWRTAVLPWLDQQALYNAIDLSKSWNDAANEVIVKTAIPLFSQIPSQPTKTTFRAPVFPGSLWHGDGPPRSFRDVIDGTSNTIAVIEAPDDAATEWANPDSWVLTEDKLMEDVFGNRDEVLVMMLDGSARALKKADMTADKLKAMLTIAGRD